MGMVFLASLPPAGLRRSINVHCTDNGSRRLGGISRDINIVNATYIEWARFL
ncbi:uncharacterized protein CLUP02_09423 [Colletotrichum lupini]|uniref:Uncharacterized protein n=1 Tax=Colletotrichum lupini TaxID=145971 RepID=A0A9Q8SWJ6_9PEZI|nr:uncharacterized protein CLUP02_09423 [Colletotrichum lupini]UQC83927.1 hypothetical protein CLUP02_09423 [Colletotrichum lupini]